MNWIIEKNKKYKYYELKKMMTPEDWKLFQIKLNGYKFFSKPNLDIKKFEDLEEEIKKNYKIIAEEIRKINSNKEVKIYAYGSRTNGTWRTNEKSEYLAKKYNLKLKYSDYDVVTDAEKIPTHFPIDYKVDILKINSIKLISEQNLNMCFKI